MAPNPYTLRNTLTNKLARLLPLKGAGVYRLGESNPPGLQGYGPVWEPVTVTLGALQTQQMRVNVQRDFHLLALTGSATGGAFRVQLYDVNNKLRLADRGVRQENVVGTGGFPFFLREPYRFDQPDSQVMFLIQNLASVSNTIQAVLYGVCLRFNEAAK